MATLKGMISKGITLMLDETKIEGLQSVPEISESQEKLETTTLANSNKTYINGLKDYGDALSFQVLYSKEEYQAVRAMQDDEMHDVKITYPDGLTVSFQAYIAVVLSSAEVNAVLTFNVEATPASDIAVAVEGA